MGVSSAKALIFDFDGVIADTEPLHWRSWAEILESFGIPFTWQQYCEVGRGIQDAEMINTLRTWLVDTSTLSVIESCNSARKQLVRELCMREPPIRPATIEMLLQLDGHRIGLVTSSERATVEPVLQAAGIHSLFEALVFGEDVDRHKPAPDPYLLIAQQLNVNTGLAFEDSTPGIASATEAGFTPVFVSHPNQLPEIVHRHLLRLPS